MHDALLHHRCRNGGRYLTVGPCAATLGHAPCAEHGQAPNDFPTPALPSPLRGLHELHIHRLQRSFCDEPGGVHEDRSGEGKHRCWCLHHTEGLLSCLHFDVFVPAPASPQMIHSYH
jgi:hypothetical protein